MAIAPLSTYMLPSWRCSMKRRLILTAAALVLGWAVGLVASQGEKDKILSTMGPVAKIGGDLLTVDTSNGAMQFTMTKDTDVKVAGGGGKTRAAKEAGEKGVKITDLVHVGDRVTVKYTNAGGKLMASEIDVTQRRPQGAQPVK